LHGSPRKKLRIRAAFAGICALSPDPTLFTSLSTSAEARALIEDEFEQEDEDDFNHHTTP